MNLSRFTGIGAICIFGLLVQGPASAQAADTGLDQSVGYYPTFQESGIISTTDYDYQRSAGGPLNGPDLDRWGATGGIWPYEYQAGGLSRLQRFMQPVDYILRPLTPGETIAVQGPTSDSWFQVAGGFPFLSRSYHPEKSSMANMFGMEAAQYSPLFFDVLSISAIGIYVEGIGPGFATAGLDDGFLSALSVDLRAGWGITDRTSLILAGQLYIIFSPDFDVQVYADAGGLKALANLNIQFELGPWDFRFYDDVTPFSTRNLLYNESVQSDGMQQVGLYYVGIPNLVDSGSWWDARENYLVNTAGFTAGTFIGDSIRFLAGFARVDTWLWNDFNQNVGSEYLSAGLFYDGYDLWVAPSIMYTMMTQDFENPVQTASVNLVAPISPNVKLYGGFGYYWGTTYDGFNWNIGLQNQLTDRLLHSIAYSSGYHDAVVGEDFIGNQVSYMISYQLGSRIHLSGFAGWYQSEMANSSDAISLGASANIALGNYTSLQVLAAYYDESDDGRFNRGASGESWRFNVTLARRLATRLHGELSFEYVDSGIGLYQQSAILLRLTRTF